MLNNSSPNLSSRISIADIVANFYVEPFYCDPESLLQGDWREESGDDAVVFVAAENDCCVITEEGPVAVAAGDAVRVIYAADTFDVGVIFVPRQPTATASGE